MTKIEINDVCKILLENNNFSILCHASPDGDTLGSAYALCRILQKMSKTARVIVPETITPRMAFLSKSIKEYDNFPDFENQYIISVDIADEKLLGDLEEVYRGKINLAIDHHFSNTGFADKLLLDETAAANAEIIYEIINNLDKTLMDRQVAEAIYIGIATDTGCFRYSNTTDKSHKYTSELYGYGINAAEINHNIFEMKTKKYLEIQNIAINNLEYHFDGKCAMIILTSKMLLDLDDDDICALSAIPRQIEGVVLGVTLKEKEKEIWKASLRSIGKINAREICNHFGGGGHIKASGCKLEGSLVECRAKLLEEIGKHIDCSEKKLDKEING